MWPSSCHDRLGVASSCALLLCIPTVVLRLQMHSSPDGPPPSAKRRVLPEARQATCLPLTTHHAPHCPGGALLAVVKGRHTQVVRQHRQRQHNEDVVQEGQRACQAQQNTRPGQGRCTAARKVELMAASLHVAWGHRPVKEALLQLFGGMKGTCASQVHAGSGRRQGCWAAEQKPTGRLQMLNPACTLAWKAGSGLRRTAPASMLAPHP